jgi:hypothetical protein
MPHAPSLDLFGLSADPRRYVALPSSERALAALQEAIRRGCSPLHLEGPSGMGKTLLLRVLELRERDAGRRVLFSPFLHLPPGEVDAWLCHLMALAPAPAGEDRGMRAAAALGELPTLLIVDELQGAPLPSARRLVEIAHAAGPRLTLLTAGRGWRPEALAPAAMIRLPATLPIAELAALCDARLAQPGAGRALAGLVPLERGRVMAASEGIPALLDIELESRAAQVERREARRLEGNESEPQDAAEDGRGPAGRVGTPEVAGEGTEARRLPAIVPREPISAPREQRRASDLARRRARAASERAAKAFAQAIGRATHALQWCAQQLRTTPARLFASARDAWRWRSQLARMRVQGLVARTLTPARRAPRVVSRACANGGGRCANALRSQARQRALQLARARARAAESAKRAQRAAQALREQGRGLTIGATSRAMRVSERAARACAAAAARGAPALQRGAERAGPWLAHARAWARESAPRRARQTLARVERLYATALSAAAHAAAGRARSAARLRSVAAWAISAPESTRLVAGFVLFAVALVLSARGCGPGAAAPPVIVAIPAAPQPTPPAPYGAQVKFPAALPEAAPGELERVAVQVNAQPWAWVRIDGVALGSTPLTHELAVGEHELEAEFADGRRLRRRIEVGPTQRFIALR